MARANMWLAFAVVAASGCAGDELAERSSSVTNCAEIFVDPANGSDSFDGCAASAGSNNSGPFRTLTAAGNYVAARRAAGAGTTVSLETGPYRSTIFGAAWSGTSSARVIVRSAPGHTAVFDGGLEPGFECFRTPTASGCAPVWVRCANTGGSAAAAACSDPDPDDGVALPAHADEYVTTAATFTNNARFGTMLASNTRLLAYSRLEDLRATNEDDLEVPLADPRPGFAIADKPGLKRLFTYRGPGLWHDARYSRIHVRLSPTHLGAGVDNYAGSTDPGQVAMSIASESTLAAQNAASFITFDGIVFQNGGLTTMLSDRTSVVFERCTFRGGREVIRLGSSQDITLRNSEVTALLGSWVARTDVKVQYDAIRPRAIEACTGVVDPGAVLGGACTFRDCDTSSPTACEQQPLVAGTCQTGPAGSMPIRCTDPPSGDPNIPPKWRMEVGTARPTAATLVASNPTIAGLTIENCELRNGHDGIQVWGTNNEVHHSLFENLNDGVFWVDGANAVDLKIHHNVIRKALQVFVHDFQGKVATKGARHYYRNIIDNRVPTLGNHYTPAAGQSPWRGGVDFKTNQPIGEFYFYHNTIVQANPDQDLLSFGLSDTLTDPQRRRYVNNVHITYGGNAPIHAIPAAAALVDPSLIRAEGNLWSRRTTVVTKPLFPGGASLPAGWLGNQFVHVPLANVPDYGLPRNAPFENSDYRLRPSSSACNAGVPLDFTSFDGGNEPDPGLPDSGALPCGALAPVRVGVLQGGVGRFVFPIPGRAVADAGDYSIDSDTDGDGFQSVQLDARQSTGASTFQWRYGFDGYLLGSTSTITVPLAVGTHQLFLSVNAGTTNAATDMREVTITDPLPFANLVANPSFEAGNVSWTFASAASTSTTTPHFGQRAAEITGSPFSEREITQLVPIVSGGGVTLSAWMKTSFTSKGSARLMVDWLDVDNVTVGSGAAEPVPGTLAEYIYRDVTVPAPTNAVRARVRLHVDSGVQGTARFDDVRLRVTDNKLRNGHFEESLDPWIADNFTTPPALTSTPADVRSASSAVELVSATTTKERRLSQAVAVTPNTAYRVSAWIKTQQLAGGGAQLDVTWLKADGTPAFTVTIGSPVTVASYVERSGSVTSPSSAAKARVDLVLPLGVTGTAWFDDVYLK